MFFLKTQWSWFLLIIAMVGDFVIPYILAKFYDGYNHKRMVMSVLGNPNSPVRACYNRWLVILGVLFIIGSFNVHEYYYSASKLLSRVVFALMNFFAIGAGILAGLFSVNESKKIETTASKIHGIASALGFIALLFVPLILSFIAFLITERVTGIICLMSFIFALVFFLLFIMSDKAKFKNTIIENEGIWQRLSLLFMYVPLAYIAIRNMIYMSRI